ncbi:hypothetical protein PPL_02905 [Heterostelium album PN500]|uniref:Myotubularin phosphatase domain-containing protein n=1 Tax=Heterostelium pallidum (strain ATCC 26659 / Pp 5 / PN500) TaxID=670386 RepID=D3B3D9_HETP5|nr:hypothetical protein PPL_02905 [Heterostelium album PN500]EFA83837.1 hypothetical protein PPL_02905 [Heterostelium album PN500]|eukprot:XP_020435954.1 hypothetical protein PPL_02905 [Heterostelium album PN500]
MMIPLMSIDSISIDNHTPGQQTNTPNNSTTTTTTPTTLTPTSSQFNISINNNTNNNNNNTSGHVTPNGGGTPTSSFLHPLSNISSATGTGTISSANQSYLSAIAMNATSKQKQEKDRDKERDRDLQESGTTSNYYTITILSKDFRHSKLYFTSQMLRDSLMDTIVFHSRTKLERILKHIETNRQLQQKIAHDNMNLEVEDRIDHIDKFEYYGVFEEPLPYLFAHVFRLPADALQLAEDGWQIYSPKREYARFGISEDSNNSTRWRFTNINKDFKMSATYPSSLVVSKTLTDQQLEKVFGYRSKGRIPALVWRNPLTGAVIVRCSQPLVGLSSARCVEDELYLSDLATKSSNIYLLDARPKLNAIANTANGAGFENIANYPNLSIWTDVNKNLPYFSNPFYQSQQEGIVLRPNLNLRCIEPWKALYQRTDSQNTYIHNLWMIQSHQQLKSSTSISTTNNQSQSQSQSQQQQQQPITISNNSPYLPATATSAHSPSITPTPSPPATISRSSNVQRTSRCHKKSYSNNSTSFDVKSNQSFYNNENNNNSNNSNSSNSNLTKSESSTSSNKSSSNPGILFIRSNEHSKSQNSQKQHFLASHRPPSKDPSPKTSMSSMSSLAQSLPSNHQSTITTSLTVNNSDFHLGGPLI